MFANILDSVVSSLWLSAYADAIERVRGRSPKALSLHPGQGGDWADCAIPKAPKRYGEIAYRVLLPIGQQLLEGYKAWHRLTREDSERFGHVLAMQMLGHGVGILDDVRTSAVSTTNDKLDVETVERLAKILPRIGESCEVFAEWDMRRGKVV